jgi:penicillin-binding protein 1C
VAITHKPRYNWKLARGEFSTRAEVTLENSTAPAVTEEVSFRVN